MAQQGAQGAEQGQNNGYGGDGKSLIVLARFISLFLPLFLHDIKKCQTDDTCNQIEYQDGDACRSPHADGIAQYHGKSPKTDHITERINLDSEAFFIFSAVLFHTGHLAVEHVAQTGERQTEQSVFCKSLEGENHAYGRGSQSQICQYNRVAVKSYHKI